MKTLKLFTFTLISLFAFSCSDHEINNPTISVNEVTTKPQNEATTNKVSAKSEADIDLAEVTKKKYNADIEFNDDGSYTIIFSDGRDIKISLASNNHYLMTGTRMPGVTIDVYHVKDDIFEFEVLEDLYGYFESSATAKPCAQHPKGESFNNCFKREWNEFCDGFIGCVAQATNPIKVAAVIAAHCATC